MINELTSIDNSEIVDSINKLLDEEQVFHPLKGDRVGRASLRREFVRAVKVVRQDEGDVEGYCANISTMGIELITQDSMRVNSKSIIQIQCLTDQRMLNFVAECRWSKDQGGGGVLSGWVFLRMIPSQGNV